MWRRLGRHIAKHPRALAGLTVMTVLSAVIDLPIPFALMRMLDRTLAGEGAVAATATEDLHLLFGALLGLAVAKAVLLWAHRVQGESLAQAVVFDLRMELFEHLQTLNMRFFRRSPVGKLSLRLMGDVQAVRQLLARSLFDGLHSALTIVGVSAAIFVVDWRLATIVLLPLPLYLAAFVRWSPRLRDSARKARKERALLASFLQERLSAMSLIKAFAREEREQRWLEHRTQRLRRRLIERAVWGGRLRGLTAFSVAVGGAAVLWLGGLAVLDGRMTGGELMAFYALAAMLFPPLRRLAMVNEVAQASLVSVERIEAFFTRTTPDLERSGEDHLRVADGAVTLEGVYVEYDSGGRALDGIDLRIAPGERIALVGPSGSGKSTLASLIAGQETADAGRIEIDGQDLAQIDRRSIRERVCYLTQECQLLRGSLRRNVRLARNGARDSEIRAALRAVDAGSVLRDLPGGLLGDVGERGRRLSGGEAQRVALARAALTEAPIVVLDEATSALPPGTELAIIRELLELHRGRTVVFVSHRPTTLDLFDRVVLVEAGRVAATGRHQDLLETHAGYRRLFATESNVTAFPTCAARHGA